jgi:hypothetical protein
MLVNPLHCSKQIGDLQSLQEAIRDGESQKHDRSILKKKRKKRKKGKKDHIEALKSIESRSKRK